MHPIKVDEIKSVKGIMETEIPQVEQTSSDETNSVKEMETEIQQVEENSEADSLEGKEITATRGTKPPLNFLAILNDANITIHASSPVELCDQLYKGVFIEPKTLMYYVDKMLNKNCFIVFARKLHITWIENSSYWKWTKEEDICDEYSEDIEVAVLLGVCWLEIKGEIPTIDLSPWTVYEVVFVVKMLNMWNYSATLTLILPHSKKVIHDENLREKPVGKWFEIQVGEFKMSPENVGEISFQLGEFSSNWKRGLVLKCAIIRPKNY
ncbi:uncharacterized protein PHLOEM PROTEIN 2-LIKE A4-like isoform X1 [Quercus robur]|uniref:uncharacterized protein PHLOEM PROTEIN 2-LIKE A4-like isoform X1 n=2 Tax=Quercus robur TaxID=38942 RepID=UPI0021626C54|nr:uncharacterized protein PHLOEM PROTEIN 2-LIKE A4-like isoform X1 [Quercus robur]